MATYQLLLHIHHISMDDTFLPRSTSSHLHIPCDATMEPDRMPTSLCKLTLLHARSPRPPRYRRSCIFPRDSLPPFILLQAGRASFSNRPLHICCPSCNVVRKQPSVVDIEGGKPRPYFSMEGLISGGRISRHHCRYIRLVPDS